MCAYAGLLPTGLAGTGRASPIPSGALMSPDQKRGVLIEAMESTETIASSAGTDKGGTLLPPIVRTALAGLPHLLREAVEPNLRRLDIDLIARAYEFAAAQHAGQKRAPGEAYIQHCIEVARLLADLLIDTISIAAGLIHDSV